MKIQILELTDTKIEFLIEQVNTSFVNSLRRILLADIPTLAIHSVEIIKNTSVLENEVIVHRIKQIPIESTTTIIDRKKCRCDDDEKGCEKCTVYLNASKKNTGKDSLYMYAKDVIKTKNNGNIPIVKLAPEDELTFTAQAIRGTAKVHTRWNAVCVATHRYKADIKLDHEIIGTWSAEQKQEIVKVCPKKVFKLSSTIEIEDAKKCIYCYQCVNKAKSFLPHTEKLEVIKQAIVLDKTPQSFIFTVETTGAISVEHVIQSAFRVLHEKLYKIQEETHSEIRANLKQELLVK